MLNSLPVNAKRQGESVLWLKRNLSGSLFPKTENWRRQRFMVVFDNLIELGSMTVSLLRGWRIHVSCPYRTRTTAFSYYWQRRKYVYRSDIILDNCSRQHGRWGSHSASAHLLVLQKSKRENRTEGSSHYKWNIMETPDSLCPELTSEALWRDIYRCSLSLRLLPHSTLCSFNGRISHRFLLNLFLLGRENDVYPYDWELPGER